MKVWRSNVSAFLALCLISATSLVADDLWNVDAVASIDGDDWEELCAVADCEQFPEGYATWAVGTDLYYFPSFIPFSEDSYLVYGSPRGDFVERDEEGEVLRSFEQTETLRFPSCCQHLLRHFGLIDDSPKNINPNWSIGEMTPSTGFLFTPNAGQYAIGRSNNSVLRHWGLSSHGSAPNPAFEELFPADLTSYNEDFWLLAENQPTNGSTPHFEVISKAPLFNDRHVFVSCGISCYLDTVSFAKDSENLKPHLSLNSFRLNLTRSGRMEDVYTCENDGAGGRICDFNPNTLDHAAEMLGIIEQMFELAKVRPSNPR